jgi:hypothetical protein
LNPRLPSQQGGQKTTLTDYLLPEDLLNASFASANLDTTGVQGSLINTLRLLECELTLAPAR